MLNHVVAVEFDSFVNEWDPNFPVSDSPHIGIDINSIRSVATAPWPLESQPHGSVGKARISYQSSSKILSVSLDYPNSPVNATVLSYPVNLGTVLPEWVRFGFTGTTGDLVETHDILSWYLPLSTGKLDKRSKLEDHRTANVASDRATRKKEDKRRTRFKHRKATKPRQKRGIGDRV
ncbi:agglutinin-2-like [Vigna radiata var. radiata]|uniref:Agglutinin-2-like n=1 Tax=Vigna radiata var. radiata TaxID=3916 RepID=A0A3Q0EKV4_VIGRR|nr:agglutinin-2-like [Vigna radiata var. radiata]